MIEFWFFSGFITLVVVVRLIRDVRPSAVDIGVVKWSERYGLSVTEEVQPFLVRRRRLSSIGYEVGLWIGAQVGALILIVLVEPHWTFAGNIALQVVWWITGGLGAVIGGSVAARLSPITGPRVARARAVAVSDYVDPVERAAVLIAAVVALIVGVGPLLQRTGAHGAETAAAAGIGGALAVGVAAAVARLTVGRPQRASSPHALAWSDALRAEIVRNALLSSAVIAASTVAVSLPTALAALGIRAGDVTLWSLLGFIVLLAAFGIRSMVTRPARYFLRRLWPATAAELAQNERPLEGVQS